MKTITPEIIRAALACIPPDLPRDEWARVAMALKAELGPSGLDVFDAWSQRSERYNETDTRDTWRSIKAGGGVSIGTLIHIAKAHGFTWSDAPDTARADPAKLKAEADARKARDDAERQALQAKHTKTAKDAAQAWGQASEKGEAPYLKRKGIGAHGLRFELGGVLVVPMRDEAGALWNIQRIAAERPADGKDKRFLSGRKSGLMHWIGQPQGAPVLLFCEGYATGASLFEATGHPVCVCFDAGNVPTVAKAVRKLHPSALMVFCGDDDKQTHARTGRNPGAEKADQAAKAVRGVATVPQDLPPKHKDFNDMHQFAGLDAVRVHLVEVITKAQAMQASTVAHQADKSSPDTRKEAGPVWDRFSVTDEGVFFLESDQDGRTKAPQWVCSCLHVTARTRDEDGQGWGFLLQFSDPVGHVKTWAMPARMLAGDGAEYRSTLLNMGLRISSAANARNRLGQYLQSRQPEEIARCADRVGWIGKAFVLPHQTIGDTDERIVYQADGSHENPYKRRGTLDAWQKRVAVHCVGNDRMLFAVSCALAGPLLKHSGLGGGGFNLRGTTSCGKSTALLAAASVWGAPDFLQRWRASDNGLEGLAAQRSGTLLLLDELAQVDAKVAGPAAYMLANGTGKVRAAAKGGTRQVLRWELLFLSSGEVTLSQHMAEGGQKSRAGQELRLADLPADSGSGGGIFNTVNNKTDGAALSFLIQSECAACYGMPGLAWLQWLTGHFDSLHDLVRGMVDRLSSEWVPEAASGQVHRVARRFALVAAGGELATEAGITGWSKGEAARGVRACFEAWMASRGGIGDAEEGQMLRQVRRLISERGAGNFAWWHRGADDRAPNPTERWGFRRLVSGDGKPIKSNSDHMKEYGEHMTPDDGESTSTEYFVFLEVFRTKLCEGYEPATVASLLLKRGHLVPGPNGRYDRRDRLPGLGNVSVYRIKASILEDEGGDA